MGINSSIGTLLVSARARGAHFGNVLTIGRQSLRIAEFELKAMAHRLGIRDIDWSKFAADGLADDFLRHLLGAQSISSIDYSDYQKVTIVHDLNQAIPTHLCRNFDAVIDGGSLEHIFDIKQVLANYMDMVKIGGRLFVATPTNNFCGHGFYQFSPELLFRVFQNVNGFTINDVILIEMSALGVSASRKCRFFRVVDPARAGRRVQLVNKRPVMIFLDASRISDEAPFCELPLQSDYGKKWRHSGSRNAPAEPFAYPRVLDRLLRRFKQLRKSSLTNRRFFEPLDPTSDAR